MKDKKKIYEELIDDVAMEISISASWRHRIFVSSKTPISISGADGNDLPEYVRDDIIRNDLSFTVQVVDECDADFDEGMIVFRFSAEEYPDVVAFSGNNPAV